MKGARLPVLLALLIYAASLCNSVAPAAAATAHVFGSAFGEEGSAPGQFKEPSGVAVNEVTLAEAGDVYVVDSGNSRVEWFSAEGAEFEGEVDGSETPAGSFSSPSAIAIDNSTNPLDLSAGDVYVVDAGHAVIDKFGPDGKYIGQIATGAGGAPLSELDGIAVDANGVVWVYRGSTEIDRYSDDVANAFLGFVNSPFGVEPGFAVDSQDNLYVNRGSDQFAKITSMGDTLSPEVNPEGNATAAAVNLRDDTVYIDEAETIGKYGPSGEHLDRFGSGHLTASHGVAVAASSDLVYAANVATDSVSVFTPVPLPDVATGEVTNRATEHFVTLTGSVNPEGVQVTSCDFEYGISTSYGSTAECSPAPGSGSAVQSVSANLAGLEVARYHYRLVASNEHGESRGSDRNFVATGHPTIQGETVSRTEATEAEIEAQVNPGGLSTAYSLEYGADTNYGSSTQQVTTAASVTSSSVQVDLTGLQPRMTYHLRLRASNERGVALGPDLLLTTPSSSTAVSTADCPNRTALGFSSVLPDCRAWESVSGAGGPQEVYVPAGFPKTFFERNEDIQTERPTRAAANGDAVSYVGEPGEAGGTGSVGRNIGDQFLAQRNSQGSWDVNNITPQSTSAGTRETEAAYESFSNDLSTALFGAGLQTLAEAATPSGPFPCEVLYSRTGDASGNEYHALFRESQVPGSCGTIEANEGFSPQNLLVAGGNQGTPLVAPYSHVLLQTPAALTPGGEPVPPGQGSNLYESEAGMLTPVNILPGGARPPAVFGGAPTGLGHSRPDFSNAISADGSQIFWTDTTTGRLYARLDGTSTVAISRGAAEFYSATSDGRFVLYLENEELWRFDTQGGDGHEREKLAGPSVVGVVGTDEALSYVYFVAGDALAVGAEHRVCTEAHEEEEELREKGELTGERQEALLAEQLAEEKGVLPPGRGCSLYVVHDGDVRFTGVTLAAKDGNLRRSIPASELRIGDWRPELGARTAEVSKSGRQLVFESTQQLTGYDNSRLTFVPEGDGHAAHRANPEYTVEVFVYNVDPEHGGLVCASCDPRGAPPTEEGSERGAGTYLPVSLSATYMRRWISEDGSRVFFDTSQPLVGQDTNGAQDVYEWEREGTEGCSVASSVSGGCVFLLSGGESGDRSFFVDASADGSNVFFTHRGQLGPVGASDQRVTLFDARIDGGGVASPTGCTGSSCQGSQSASFSSTSPATLTFPGAQNFSPPVNAPLAKRPTRRQLLAKALAVCRRHKKKHTRVACERRARKRYGVSKTKRSKAKRKATSSAPGKGKK